MINEGDKADITETCVANHSLYVSAKAANWSRTSGHGSIIRSARPYTVVAIDIKRTCIAYLSVVPLVNGT